MQPWESAQVVDAPRAAALVEAQFPELAGAPVREVAAGWDNSVLLVGDVLFRFPRREIALALMDRELAVLPQVAGRLPLDVPLPTHVGAPAGDYPWPFWGGRMLPGTELLHAPHADRRQCAEALGGFLRVLHGLQVDVDLPHDPNGRSTPVQRAEVSRRWLDAMRQRGAWSGSAAVDALVDSPLDTPPGPGVLVHGDLHLRHLLVDERGRASGVIDWGDTCFADPCVDLSFGYAAFDGADREAFLAAYGPVDAEREERSRSLAVSLCAALGDWASSVGDEQALAELLRGLERAVS